MTSTLLRLVAIPLLLAQQDPPRFVDRVDVARVLIDVRAIDGRGQPLTGLTADNFGVRIDGRPARVESAQWVTGVLAAREEALPPTAATAGVSPPAVQGRLVVFLFQKSLERTRITGFMRMLLRLRGFTDAFTPHDRLAVLSFDSRLRLWADFTADTAAVQRILERNILFGGPPPPSESVWPSLREAVAMQQTERVWTIEAALHAVAVALEPLPGAKTVVLVGHGFGGVDGEVTAALHRARAAVFCLDVTDADSHTLESGLQSVAEETGGFFARTHQFAGAAIDRLGAALAGHYVLIVEKPVADRGLHRIDVDLKGRSGLVFARNIYVD